MKNFKIAFVAIFLVVTTLWLMADSLLPHPFNYFSFRKPFVLYSGIIGFTAMSVATVLAARPRCLEGRLQGLDKMYRLHKWLGITGLGAAVVHWWFTKGTQWMVGWGWLTRPHQPKRGVTDLSTFEGWLRSQRHLAETLGEWAFYFFVIMMIIALWKRIPYRWFQYSHQLMSVVYLIFAFHFVVLMKFSYWSQPIGMVMAVLTLCAVCSALLALFGKIGKKISHTGVITALQHDDINQTTTVDISVANNTWGGHQAGQFAFLRFEGQDGAHPFTIASAWQQQESKLTFVIKALGDYTQDLQQKLRPDMPVHIEGPYGRFTFNDACDNQIWVGAGIGITPFIAALEQLRAQPQTVRKHIVLYHCVRHISREAQQQLQTLAEQAQVTLHLYRDEIEGLLSADTLTAQVQNWHTTSVWFCGPMPFGVTLQKQLQQHGMLGTQFHQELFHMR